MLEFQGFPKIPRLNRGMTITEKIDGTNAAIGIVELPEWPDSSVGGQYSGVVKTYRDPETDDVATYGIYAQSRKRIIYPGDDNFGFAKWVAENAHDLVHLGPGLHFGEWWGSGIQRGYGLTHGEKRFSLFNASRWSRTGEDGKSALPGCCLVVPILYEGQFDVTAINETVAVLSLEGSHAAPGFRPPEGVIVFQHAARSMFKVTCTDDEQPKSVAAGQEA
jgi:hypothetical protein